MQEKFKHYLIIAFGWFFLILGIIGLFLPFLQGILFILIGLYLLSYEYHWARCIFKTLKKRYPKMYKKFYDIKEKTSEKFEKILSLKRIKKN